MAENGGKVGFGAKFHPLGGQWRSAGFRGGPSRFSAHSPPPRRLMSQPNRTKRFETAEVFVGDRMESVRREREGRMGGNGMAESLS